MIIEVKELLTKLKTLNPVLRFGYSKLATTHEYEQRKFNSTEIKFTHWFQ